MEIWTVPNIWKNQECWILGGGSSVVEEFDIPKDIVDGVRARSLSLASYSPYMEKIHSKFVIGINIAMFLGDWVDISYFGDNNYFLKYKELFPKVKGLVIGSAPILSKLTYATDPYTRYLKYIKIAKDKIHGICTNPSFVYSNLNSGGSSIGIAHNLGVKRIILVGFDMALDVEKNQHWHKEYAANAVLPFGKHLPCFEQISRDAIDLGIEIINASPKSKITQFRKASVKELL